MAFWSLSSLRSILATETDADSPGSEELLSQLRENWEALTMLAFDTGVSGVADSVSTTTLLDTGNFAGDDVHNGHTLLITSGVAIGNTYTIDDTTANAVYCLGDDLEADGVVATDTYKILYDLKVNTDGHDHDGINSATVVLADDQVTQAKIDAAAVGQAQLKTSTGEANTGSIGDGADGNCVPPGGTYAFYPQIKADTSAASTECGFFRGTLGTSYVQQMGFHNGSGGARTFYCQTRYVTASGPLNWLYLLKDKATGENRGEWFAPDHCCWGHTQDPDKMPHPFSHFDSAIHDLVIIHPTNEQVIAARKEIDKNEDMSIFEAFWSLYEIDSSAEESWPTDDISVGLVEDWDTGKKTVLKKKIKKPEGCKCYKLKVRGA